MGDKDEFTRKRKPTENLNNTIDITKLNTRSHKCTKKLNGETYLRKHGGKN